MADLTTLATDVSLAVEAYQRIVTTNAATPTTASDDDAYKAQLRIAEAAKRLALETEDPMRRIFLISHQAAEVVALRIAIDLGLFEKFPLDGEVTLDELNRVIPAERALLVRVLRMLTAMSFVIQPGIDRYALSRHGKPLRSHKYQSMVIMGFDVHLPSMALTPSFLRKSLWRNPRDASNTPFHMGHRTEQTLFEYMADNPDMLTHFHNALSTANDFGLYQAVQELPWPEIIGQTKEDNAVAMVDIGGADGSVLRQILERFPAMGGRFILQDRPEVIGKAIVDLPEKVEAMAYDFFTPQPVEGARAYHYRMVFHDWPLEDCRRILRNLKPAMRLHYSKLLIGDSIIPDMGATLQHCQLDYSMMTIVAEEKTETQFRDLLESEGFEIKNIWHTRYAVDCILEAELREHTD